MALVNVNNILVLNNPTNFLNPFQFEITFECLQALEDDLEWKVLYVGKAAADATQDLVLDEILVGPVPVGIHQFILTADAPPPNQLEEILGVTVVLVTCSYRDKEFVRVGYYVNNEYEGYNNTNTNTSTTDATDTDTAWMNNTSLEDDNDIEHDDDDDDEDDEENDDDEKDDDDDDDDDNEKENGDKKEKKKQKKTNASTTTVTPALPPPPPPPSQLDMSKVTRQLLADKPRVTKFTIPWGDEDETQQQQLLLSSNHDDNNNNNNAMGGIMDTDDKGDTIMKNQEDEMDEEQEEEEQEEDEDDDDEDDDDDDNVEVDLTANE